MKTVLTVLFLVVFTCGYAQTDSDTSTIYRHGLPVSEDDTVKNFPDVDFEPLTQYERMLFRELPADLQDELRENDRFAGWPKGSFYFDKVNERFMVVVPVDSLVQIFGFDKNGNVITFDEQPKHDD